MSTGEPLELLLRKLSSHVRLDDGDQAAVLGLPRSFRELKASAYIIREGETPGPCVILVKGFAYRQKMVEDGSRQILSLQIPGEALDMQHLFLDYADHNVQALTDVTLAMVPRAALRQVALERPNVAHAFSVSNLVDASIFREWLLNVGRRDARRRIAHLLCEVALRLEGQELEGEYGYELPMTQEQIGDATGLTSVHVNRMLRGLEGDGLIMRHGRFVQFPDWTKMKDEAGFDPLYLHLDQQAAASSRANPAPT